MTTDPWATFDPSPNQTNNTQNITTHTKQTNNSKTNTNKQKRLKQVDDNIDYPTTNNNFSYSNAGYPSMTNSLQTNSNADDVKLSKLPPAEREKAIKKAFKLVLGREPTLSELSRYKYSMVTKGNLLKELLKSKEHKDLLSKGNKYKELNLNKEKLEQKVFALENEIKSMQQEHVTLKLLLKEKNKHIHQLREHINTMYAESTGSFPARTLAEHEPEKSVAAPAPFTTAKPNHVHQNIESNNKSIVNSILKRLVKD